MSGAGLLLLNNNGESTPSKGNLMSASLESEDVQFHTPEPVAQTFVSVGARGSQDEDEDGNLNRGVDGSLTASVQVSGEANLTPNMLLDDKAKCVEEEVHVEPSVSVLKIETMEVKTGKTENGGLDLTQNLRPSYQTHRRQPSMQLPPHLLNGRGGAPQCNGNSNNVAPAGTTDTMNSGITGVSIDSTDPIICAEMESSSCWGSEKRRLGQILKRKQEERSAEIARLQAQYRSLGDHKKVLNLSFDELVEALQRREITASETLDAYIAKALDATSKFNNVTDFIPQAYQWAKELDSLPQPKGPLHGIPFCVKDDTNVEGMDTTHGYVKRLYKPAMESAVLVKVLQDLGGVPFCKTNVPQTLFTYGSDNPVFGETTNCTNPKLSPGGSSSGTGSLVGAHGAMFGTGTDIGGSLRIPAHFNGCSSIKPTVGRVSYKGIESSLPNLIGLTPVAGIIGQTPTVVATVFKAAVEEYRQHKYDPFALPIPWNDDLFRSKEKLRIGYLTSVPYFPAMGDTEETVLRAKSSLESLGHTLVPFTMPDQYHYMNVIARFLLADHTRHFKKCWKGEKVARGASLVWLSSLIPNSVQKLVGRMMTSRLFPFLYSKRTSVFFGAGACSSTDLWDTEGEKQKVIDAVYSEWARLELDAVICPLFPFPAPPVQNPGLLPIAVVYAMIWNLVDFPSGVVPFGKESGKNFDKFDNEGDVALKLAEKGIKESVGAPISVQVVALPYKEEQVFRVMLELEKFYTDK